MEPRIQYAQTKDGVSIAYSTAGIAGIPERPVWVNEVRRGGDD